MSTTATPRTTHGQDYGEWVAPKYDKALLIWPEASTLPQVAIENGRALDSADSVVFAGRPLPEWRRMARAFVGHDSTAPLFVTGHQSELHHPGVWVKNVIIDAATKAAGNGAAALHLAVDTDAPKHLRLRWPGFEKPITDDPRLHGAAWSGLLDPPSPAYLDELLASDAPPLVRAFLEDCRRYLIEQRDSPSPMTLPGVMADSEHRLDWSLGLRHSTVMLSGVLECEAWAAMVCQLMGDAENFASHYNAALADYRAAEGVTDPDRPMPDLAVTEGTIELPLWFDDLDRGVRARAVLHRTPAGFELRASTDGEGFVYRGGEPVELLRWMRRNRCRLAPRALALTMFMRLFVADVFVHGIGGGHYDQVLDRLLVSYCRIRPPRFVVASSTLLHPAALERERVCLPCLKRERHRIEHSVLGDRKSVWLQEIARQPTFRERRRVFDAMHAERKAAVEHDERFQDWQRRWDEAQQRLTEEAILFDRELFYAVQPRERLVGLIEQVREAFQA